VRKALHREQERCCPHDSGASIREEVGSCDSLLFFFPMSKRSSPVLYRISFCFATLGRFLAFVGEPFFWTQERTKSSQRY
jgi:hypothetical protein